MYEETRHNAELIFIHGVYFSTTLFTSSFVLEGRKDWCYFGEMVRTVVSFGYQTRRIQNIKQLTVRISDD